MINAGKHKLGRLFYLCFFLIGTIFICAMPNPTTADNNELTDYDWLALYLVKLSMDIEWPETTYIGELKEINVCIIGNSPGFEKSLASLVPKAEQKKLKIIIKTGIGIENIHSCNIAYIPRGNTNYREIVAATHKLPILTVAAIEAFAANKGIIEFVLADIDKGSNDALNNKVNIKFRINNNVAIESGLKIGTEALNSALEVIK